VPADLQLLPLDHLGPSAPGLGLLMVALMHVHSEGRVRLAAAGDGSAGAAPTDPAVELDLLSDERDERRLRAGVEVAVRTLDHPAFRAIVDVEPPPIEGPALRAVLGDYVHASGTCRMGAPHDDEAVVDPACRVIGYTGLRVCDASVLPDLPRANPHLTIVVVAERLAAAYRVASSSSIDSWR
jgi:5-(hydroxymethyl)furfural/furfural oxidase